MAPPDSTSCGSAPRRRRRARRSGSSKPAGISYPQLFAAVEPALGPVGGSLWVRKMTLGPSPEFCVLAREPAVLAPQFQMFAFQLRPVWDGSDDRSGGALGGASDDPRLECRVGARARPLCRHHCCSPWRSCGGELLSSVVPRLAGRARAAVAIFSFVLLPLAGAMLGWLEGRLKLR